MKELTAIDRLLEQFVDDASDEQMQDALCELAQSEKPKESDKQSINVHIDFPELHMARTATFGDEWSATYRKALEVVNANAIAAIIGNRGTGKTQMAWNIAKECKLANVRTLNRDSGFTKEINRPAIYRTAMDIFLELRSTYAPKADKTEWQLMKEYENAALLVIDEINVSTGNAFEDLKMTAIMDKRYKKMRPTILIGNVDLQQFSDRMGKSVINRIEEDGIILSCNWQSYRTKKPL